MEQIWGWRHRFEFHSVKVLVTAMLSILKCIKNSFTDYTVLCLLFTQCIHTLIYLLFLFYFLCYSYVFYCTFYWKHNFINIWPKILFVFGYFENQTRHDKTFHLYLIEMSLSTVMSTIFMVCRQAVITVLRKKLWYFQERRWQTDRFMILFCHVLLRFFVWNLVLLFSVQPMVD